MKMGRPVKDNKTGEVRLNGYGMKMTIIRYGKYNDIDVLFEDGYISYNKSYKEFKNGMLVSMIEREKRHPKKVNTKVIEKINDLDGEVWKDIIGYEGLYQISNKGRCKSLKRTINRTIRGISSSYVVEERLIKTQKGGNNDYLFYPLHKDGEVKTYLVHRLIAIHFIPNPENKEQVNHIDENVQNYDISNLEWVTPKENANHGTRNQRSLENHNYNKIVQLTLDGEYIQTFNNAKLASREVGLTDSTCIIRCCKGKQKQTKGYKWLYEKDYLNMITRREVTA